MSFHINILRKAGFISVTVKHNTRGNAKIISRQIDSLAVGFIVENRQSENKHFSMDIPIGSFTDAQIEAGCGMASTQGIIIADDTPGGILFARALRGAKSFGSVKVISSTAFRIIC